MPERALPHHLQNLNPEQLAAVKHGEGPLLVFAGAGSGKTRVLTRRLANLVLEHNVCPEEILAVTFTNKAALEMKKRVSELLAGRPSSFWVSTFHASCARILRANARSLDFTENFAIYDTADSHSTLRRAYDKLGIDPRDIEIRSVASTIDRAKNEYLFPDDIRQGSFVPQNIAELTADLYAEYQRLLHESNAMDFGDLLCNVITLFTLEPKVLEKYRDQFTYQMIDEYQDTNKVQYLLVKMLSEKRRNLCVVGDDDQSIYAFRGATVENILNFKKDFPDAVVIKLEQNYRSSKNILTAANHVIAKNRTRQEKTMRTANTAGLPIYSFAGEDERAEGGFIAREISHLLEQGVKPRDIAIFYRTNAQSRAIEEELCEAGIPYEIYGGQKFYDRKEVKDILAYFRLLVNPNDNEAFLRIINTPTRGLGATSVAGLMAYADAQKVPLLAALEKGLQDGAQFLTTANKKRFLDFSLMIQELRKEGEKTKLLLSNLDGSHEAIDALPALLLRIAERSNYLPNLRAEETLEAQSRLENVFELFAVASEFVRRSWQQRDPVTLSAFLERASLSSDAEGENRKVSGRAEKIAQGGTISMMTLHLAKGLEFEVVFLTGLEEGLLPHIRSLDDRRAMEEERRLCYVGITRARQRLYLTRATWRESFGRNNFQSGIPSRFLDDVPSELVESRYRQSRTVEYW